MYVDEQLVDSGTIAWRLSLVPSNQAKRLARKCEGSHPGENASCPFPNRLSVGCLSLSSLCISQPSFGSLDCCPNPKTALSVDLPSAPDVEV